MLFHNFHSAFCSTETQSQQSSFEFKLNFLFIEMNEKKVFPSIKTLEQVSCFYFLSKTFERLTTISVYNYNETFDWSASSQRSFPLDRDPENIAFQLCSSGSLYLCVGIVIQTMTYCADWQASNKERGDYCAAASDDIESGIFKFSIEI